MDKRVAFFAISTHLGGAERSLNEFLSQFKNETSDFLVVFPKSSGPFIDELKTQNISVKTLNTPHWLLKTSRKWNLFNFINLIGILFYAPFYLLRIHRLIKKEKIKIIHSTGLKFHCFLCLYSLFVAKVQIYIHFRDIITNPFLLLFFKLLKNRKIIFIANSKATSENIMFLNPQVIYNGLDPKQYFFIDSSLKKFLNIKKEDHLIAIVGAITRWKGQREFIQVAESLFQERGDLHFLIVGNEIYDTQSENGELAYLKRLVQNSFFKNHFHFMEFQKDLKPIYSGIDLLVHASIHPEPFGRVILEAMLCSCPVTAANSGGALEIIQHKKNGYLHNMKDLKSVAENIIEIIDHPEIQDKIVAQALKDCQLFTLKSQSLKLTQLILDRK